jgi:hypothetical protein
VVNFKNELIAISSFLIKCVNSNAQKLELSVKSNNDKLNSSINGKIKSNSFEIKSKGYKSVEKKYSNLF